MSETPISDSTPHNVGDLAMVCRRLERKLAATRKYLSEVSERAKRLEEALEAVAKVIGPIGKSTWASDEELNHAWELYIKTKEIKP
jgi:hypothetical protein